MLTVLHGDNLVATYTALTRLRESFVGEVLSLEAKSLNEKTIEEILGQGDLFAPKKLVIIAGLPKAAFHKILNQFSNDQDIIIWADKKVATGSLKGKVLEFKDTSGNANFKFADNFTGRDLKGSLAELDKLLKDKVPIEIIIGILNRQLTLMVQVFSQVTGGINPYVVQKIKLHQNKWTYEQIKTAFENLLEVDHQSKTGRMEPKTALLTYLIKTL